ncbi:50S ribosomal protein L4 [Candidatus Kaiserbacteria bacterium]|nr:50S ribosomal protein L4 [Candidatus Kaiserbacteria bacterium]
MESPIYNTAGKKTGTIALPESIFAVKWNDSLMYQVVTAMQANARTPVAHVKTRGDVRGGGKKPWAQKGTGRARHGSIRSPIWRGGGVTHGPRSDKSYARTIPKKMRIKALTMALSQKFKDGGVVFIDSLGLEEPKTAAAKKVLVSVSGALGLKGLVEKKANAAFVALADPRESATKSFRNLGNIECKAVRELNPVSVLKHSYLIIENPEAALAILSHRIGEKVETTTPRAKKPKKVNMKAVHAAEKGDQ